MRRPFDENPTRENLIMLLKKNNRMTVSTLSQEMGITHMAVRQHLMYLENRGIVAYTVKKAGVGRPVFQYSLTDKAAELFPTAYSRFTNELLQAVVHIDGKKKLNSLMRHRKEKLLREYSEQIMNFRTFSGKIKRLAKYLDDKGYMVELEKRNGKFLMKQFNCLLPGVSDQFPEVCRYELELYKSLLGDGVTRESWRVEGSPFCGYLIPSPTKSNGKS